MAELKWKHLVGTVWNKTAFNFISQAKEIQIDDKILAKQRNDLTLTVDEQIKVIKFNYAQYIIGHELETHAICEARERKRNEMLGKPPTLSEVQYLIEKPEEEESSSAPKLSDYIDPENESFPITTK